MRFVLSKGHFGTRRQHKTWSGFRKQKSICPMPFRAVFQIVFRIYKYLDIFFQKISKCKDYLISPWPMTANTKLNLLLTLAILLNWLSPCQIFKNISLFKLFLENHSISDSPEGHCQCGHFSKKMLKFHHLGAILR